jgi:hypothetical protein
LRDQRVNLSDFKILDFSIFFFFLSIKRDGEKKYAAIVFLYSNSKTS